VAWLSVWAMHRSKLRALMIDVPGPDLAPATAFWAGALGLNPNRTPAEAHPYLTLLPSEEGIRVTLQRLGGDTAARFHVDIETDDLEAEVNRLKALGAQEIERSGDWVVMRDPAGLPVCVVPVESTDFDATATSWP
jgi:catechol 2,3-dioxygenase-like lactoylglutathione lyase family enzyme